jgi:hypothetical protein
MTTPHTHRRRLARLTIFAGLAFALLGVGPARGQTGPQPTMPAVHETVTVPAPAADPPAPAPKGLATTGSGTQQQSHLGETTVNAVTHGCPDSTRDESRLGLMQHTAMYSHCDYP